jgi:hypothetical protein
VEGGVEAAVIDGMAADHPQAGRQNFSQSHPAGGDPQQQQPVGIGDALEHLGGQAVQSAGEVLGREQFEPIHGAGTSNANAMKSISGFLCCQSLTQLGSGKFANGLGL